MKSRILIVEDEPDMARVLQYNLRQAGHDTLVTATSAEALEAIRTFAPDLVLLDWMLPDRPGTEVCRQLRREPETATLPIIMVSARGEEIDRVVGFELGVDDYVTKPFSVRELLLRVSAILARSTVERRVPPAEQQIGELRLDLTNYRAYLADEEIILTELESRLLRVLTGHLDRVVRRDELLNEVWGPDSGVTTVAVDSHVKRLRTKLRGAGRLIQTVRGVGYTLSTAERPSRR